MIRNQYPMRSRYLIVPAIILALCLGVSSAMAEPLDQGPSVKPRATANVYVPPRDISPQQDLVSPDARDAGLGSLPGQASTGTDGGSGPLLAIGLSAGCVVLLCGCAVGIRRTRRTRRHVG